MARAPKTPQEKKRLSLEKDRRNTYGENDKSSRKNIPLSKARSHRAVRRKGKAEVDRAGRLDEAADLALSTLATPRLQKGTWRKWPDKPLGDAINRKRVRRASKPPQRGGR